MTSGRTLRVILVSAAALGWAAGGTAWADRTDSPEGAAAFIETLGREVLAVQTSTRVDAAKARLPALRVLIRSGFDLDLTSQLVLGKFWGRATEAQRTTFKDLFARYLLNTYARHLDSYRVDTLAVIASNRAGERDYLVQTGIQRENELADAVWRVRAGDDGYRIIDVLLDGISLTLTHRSEFASVARKRGLDGMLEILRDRVSRQANAPDGYLRVALPASILVSPNASKIDLLLHQR